MKIFLDSADTAEIKTMCATGLVDGVTTNPTLIAQSGRKLLPVLAEICALTSGPVSAEVVATDTDGMLHEATFLQNIAPNIVIKLPLTTDGLQACQILTGRGVKTNVTLCFNATQGLLAMKSGATYLSPFIGRLIEHGGDGLGLLRDLVQLKNTYGFKTQILAASVRDVPLAHMAAQLGADCATLKPAVLKAMLHHALTDAGLASFLRDWQATGQSFDGVG